VDLIASTVVPDTGNSPSLNPSNILVFLAELLVIKSQSQFSVSEPAALGSVFYFSLRFRSLMTDFQC
jgi:hypothetical protein